ncbi:hypothetical protein ACFLYS_02145 [Chloroflexota bacterium]
MITKRSNVLMIYEEEIQQLVYEWIIIPDWIKAHVSPKSPAHRYEGELILDSKKIAFSGWDIKVGRDFALEIPLNNIIDVSLSFSKNLRSNTNPAFGIGGPTPFVVRYQDNDNNRIVYFNTSFNNYVADGDRTNRRWYEEIDEIVTALRRSNSNHIRNREPVAV